MVTMETGPVAKRGRDSRATNFNRNRERRLEPFGKQDGKIVSLSKTESKEKQ